MLLLAIPNAPFPHILLKFVCFETILVELSVDLPVWPAQCSILSKLNVLAILNIRYFGCHKINVTFMTKFHQKNCGERLETVTDCSRQPH